MSDVREAAVKKRLQVLHAVIFLVFKRWTKIIMYEHSHSFWQLEAHASYLAKPFQIGPSLRMLTVWAPVMARILRTFYKAGFVARAFFVLLLD